MAMCGTVSQSSTGHQIWSVTISHNRTQKNVLSKTKGKKIVQPSNIKSNSYTLVFGWVKYPAEV